MADTGALRAPVRKDVRVRLSFAAQCPVGQDNFELRTKNVEQKCYFVSDNFQFIKRRKSFASTLKIYLALDDNYITTKDMNLLLSKGEEVGKQLIDHRK